MGVVFFIHLMYLFFLLTSVTLFFFSANPGNNLHVSGLSHKVDTRELEATFAKIGRVRFSLGPD